MWLGEKAGTQANAQPDIQIGRVTIAGGKPAVMLDGEIRNVAVASPMGYGWLPEAEDEVLVLKTDGEWFIIARAQQPMQAKAGEAGIYSDGAGVSVNEKCVALTGAVEIHGSLKINGTDIMSLISAEGGK